MLSFLIIRITPGPSCETGRFVMTPLGLLIFLSPAPFGVESLEILGKSSELFWIDNGFGHGGNP